MGDVTTTIDYAKNTARLACGKASVLLACVGDDAFEMTAKGANSARSWWMLGARIGAMAEAMQCGDCWDEAAKVDGVPMECGMGALTVERCRSGVEVTVDVDADVGDEPAVLKVTACGMVSLSIKADRTPVDCDQMRRLSEFLMGLAGRLIREPLGIFSADVLRAHAAALTGEE